MDRDGDERSARGIDAAGRAFLSAEEVNAAHRLRADWEAGQAGLIRGSDWQAPPRGATPRSAGGVEAARSAGLDARRRLDRALGALAPMLAQAVTAACLKEQGLAEIERAQHWPARSGKLALKLGLAQLAEIYRG